MFKSYVKLPEIPEGRCVTMYAWCCLFPKKTVLCFQNWFQTKYLQCGALYSYKMVCKPNLLNSPWQILTMWLFRVLNLINFTTNHPWLFAYNKPYIAIRLINYTLRKPTLVYYAFKNPYIISSAWFDVYQRSTSRPPGPWLRQGPEWEDKMNANGGHFQAPPSGRGIRGSMVNNGSQWLMVDKGSCWLMRHDNCMYKSD